MLGIVNEKELGTTEAETIMLGYRVHQAFHPSFNQMVTKERGGSGPVFTTSQLLQPYEEPRRFVVPEDDDFIEEKDSGTSEEGPSSYSNEELTFFRNPTWVRAGSESQSHELVDLLTLCTESIGDENYAVVGCCLSRLGELASPFGAPVQRVTAYFAEALALRAFRLFPQIFSISPPREISEQIDYDDDGFAFRLLNQVSPIPRFLHFTLNERLVRAFEGKEIVHIIDFDIKEGLQWPSLLQSLASRPNPPTHVRVTGIGDSRQGLLETGARLKWVAEELNFRFEFHPVVDQLEDVRLWMLHVKEGECVAVNCVAQLHKAQGGLMNLLELVRSTNPTIVLLAEEEAEHNDPRWEMRFANSLRYYSAIFDSIDSTLLPEDSAARVKIEEMFARRIRNIVSSESMERIERHESFEKWSETMNSGGFRSLDFGEGEEMQSKLILKMYSSGENYGVERRKGASFDGLTLKWNDQGLYTVSAWAPMSFEGSPTSLQG